MEVTKWLKPSDSVSRYTVTPQRSRRPRDFGGIRGCKIATVSERKRTDELPSGEGVPKLPHSGFPPEEATGTERQAARTAASPGSERRTGR